ncbi:MAG TPA: hypothetical protein VF941_01035 [Clostridia bacterium]
MKNIAIGLLMVVLLSVLVEPMVEIANVMREKIVLGTALSNACRAAKDRSLIYEKQRDRNAEIDQDMFKDYFAEAFESAMNVTRKPTTGSDLTFTSNDGKYNTFTVTLDIVSSTDPVTEQTVTQVNAKAESKYKFKTKYLKLAEGSESVGYDLTSERMLLLRVRN